MKRLAVVAAVAALALTASCNQNVVRTMIPSPIVMQDERLDFSQRRTADLLR